MKVSEPISPETAPIIFGECLYDVFPDGAVVLGGAPFNVAWHLQGFGLAPIFISRVGDDPLGHQLRQRMLNWGMSCVGLQLDASHQTGRVQVSLEQGQPSYEILDNRAWDFIETDALPPLNPGLIYHGSLGLRSQTSAQAFDWLSRRYQAPRYFDVNLRPPFWQPGQIQQLMGHCRWLKLNDEELTQLVPEDGELEAKARRLLQGQPQLEWLLITRGGAGAWLFDATGTRQEITPGGQLEIVDSVGAGDAFTAVTILGIQHKWPIPLMLSRAQEFAGQILMQRGATSLNHTLYDCLRQLWQL
jgi:fructokinase